jgi:glyoxylase-like metal-dependent hydrolase (beta-lactamase superfamily II)
MGFSIEEPTNMNLPVANQWFVRKRMDEQITLLTEPYVHSFLRCNIWHIRGRDRDLLIDTGMGLGSLNRAAGDLFENLLTVVITHTHVDHSGGAHEFESCLVHEAEEESLRDAKDHLPLATRSWPADLVAMMEADQPVGEYVISARPSEAFEPDNYRLQPASVSIIGEGDMVDLGDRAFEVLHLPGHSPGSIGLWEASTGTLFSGDAVYDARLLDELPGSDKAIYRKTMERLLELPVEVVHGGHVDSFGRDRLREIATAYLAGRQLEY